MNSGEFHLGLRRNSPLATPRGQDLTNKLKGNMLRTERKLSFVTPP